MWQGIFGGMKVVLKHLSRPQRVAKGQTIESGQAAGRPTLTTNQPSLHLHFAMDGMAQNVCQIIQLGCYRCQKGWQYPAVSEKELYQYISMYRHFHREKQISIGFLWVFIGVYGFFRVSPTFSGAPKKKVLALLGLHLCVPRPSHFSDLRFARAVATDLLLPGCWLLARLQEPSTISSTNSMQ